MEALISGPLFASPRPGFSCGSRRSLPPQVTASGATGKSHEFANGRSASRRNLTLIRSGSITDLHRCKSNLESLFCYDKAIPEEIIEKPVGLSLEPKEIGSNPPCSDCQTKGAVLCPTCSGSGLYVESILESQGIIVKVRCLGCGGTGNTMCLGCGGRGHL